MHDNFFTFIRTHWYRLALLSSLLTIMILWHWYLSPWMLDDAFISFRYAEHWAQGLGPVYNIGERVEGYTTFLWVALLALGNWIGITSVFLAKTVGYLSAVATLTLLLFLDTLLPEIKKEVGVIAALLLGTSGVFLPWAMSGMETSLFTLLLLLSVVCYLLAVEEESNPKQLFITSIVLTLLTLTRPEGALISMILFVHYLLKYRNKWYWLLLPFFILYGGYFTWRFFYYQSLLPNTFYTKVGFTIYQVFRGIRYTNRFALATAGILVPVLLWTMDRSFSKVKTLHIPLISSIVALYTAYIIVVGGDIMPAFRFYTAIMPLICVLASSALMYIFQNKRFIAVAIFVIVSYNFYQLARHHELNLYFFQDVVAQRGAEVGLWLREHTLPDTVIATNTAGSLAYYSDRYIIDMLGLNDIYIAREPTQFMGIWYAGHEKGDGAYVLSRKPDIIIWHASTGAPFPLFKSDLELDALPAFHDQYTLQEITLPSQKILYLWVRNDSNTLVSH